MSTIPVRFVRTNLKLNVDSQKAALLGVPTVEFDRAVRSQRVGSSGRPFKDSDGEQYDIMRAHADERTARPERARSMSRVTTLSGDTLPLSQLAKIEFTSAPTRDRSLQSRPRGHHQRRGRQRLQHGSRDEDVLLRLDQMQWPRGYYYVPGGELESRAESFGGLQAAILIALLGIVAILVLEFGSFKSTLIVLTVVPFGIAGGIVMLALTGNTISFTAMIGFIALIGIETKNSILLVDFTNQLRAQGVPLDEAIERAGEIRFLPDPAHERDGDRRPAAAGGAERRHVLTARVGDHRRTHFVDTRRARRHAGDVQADSADDSC